MGGFLKHIPNRRIQIGFATEEIAGRGLGRNWELHFLDPFVHMERERLADYSLVIYTTRHCGGFLAYIGDGFTALTRARRRRSDCIDPPIKACVNRNLSEL